MLNTPSPRTCGGEGRGGGRRAGRSSWLPPTRPGFATLRPATLPTARAGGGRSAIATTIKCRHLHHADFANEANVLPSSAKRFSSGAGSSEGSFVCLAYTDSRSAMCFNPTWSA